MSGLPDPLERLWRPDSGDAAIDRKALAGALLDIARNIRPDLPLDDSSARPADPRLEQVRNVLLGSEIRALARLNGVIDDPEQLAAAVGRVLPAAFAQMAADARLGQVLAPTVEKATRSSIRSDPRTLINIIYPLIVPAIRKSIGETIDKTFQSLNESLRHSLSWRGLRWRWEAWRTGATFAEVVLRHTLLYQVEHVFLIHRHTGLLIGHAAAPDATTQDPQLVSAMLVAIQDFVRDSFGGAGQQGVDTLRLGEFRLWSEPGPSATLVAVIRGNPPEELHDTLLDVVARIHAERHQALEDFDGDSSGLADIEAELTNCVAHRQQLLFRSRRRWPWLVAAAFLLLAAGAWAWPWWQTRQRWEHYLARLGAEPGIVITRAGHLGGKFAVSGLRDPFAANPGRLLAEAGLDPASVTARWTPYEALDPELVLRRLEATLAPPPTVAFRIDGSRIVADGSATSSWLGRARNAGATLPAGAPVLDLSAVRNVDGDAERRWGEYLARLRAQPGIVITEAEQHDGRFLIGGLRDPLAADPQRMVREAGIDPGNVVSHWAPYEALDPPLVLKRLQARLDPPPDVTLTPAGDRIVAQGTAPAAWIDRARTVARMLPVGAPALDLSAVHNVGGEALDRLRAAIQSHSILFNYNQSLPAPAQDATLDEVAAELNSLATLAATNLVHARVMLTGHSDDVGEGTFNLSLSLARAEAVRALLRKRNVDPDLLAVRGAGALEPLASETTDAARAANRRVSLSVEIDEQP